MHSLAFLHLRSRVALLLGFACTGLVGASFYVQHVLGVEPCPLCIIQRFIYLALAIVFLGAALAPFAGRAAKGPVRPRRGPDAGRLGRGRLPDHLQFVPPALAATCSASLSYMLETLSFTDVLARLLNAKGDCSDTSFKILGLTLAQAR